MAKPLVSDELLGDHRATHSGEREQKMPCRAQVSTGSRMFDRHPLRAAVGRPVENVAPGDGRWVGHDRLAASTRLEGSWRVADGPGHPLEYVASGRPNRLPPFRRGQRDDPRSWGGERTGPSPVGRRKPGSKHHLRTDGNGIPIVAKTTAANRHDVTQRVELVNDVPAIKGKAGTPRVRFAELYADRAYDSDPHRGGLMQVGTDPKIARRNTDHDTGLGVYRWVVERTISWLHQFRRLRIR